MNYGLYPLQLIICAALLGAAAGQSRAQEPAPGSSPPKKHLFGSPNSKSKIVKTSELEVKQNTETSTENSGLPAEIKPVNDVANETAQPDSAQTESAPSESPAVKPETLQTSVDPTSTYSENKIAVPDAIAVKSNNPAEIYKIGGGDVLDIKLLNASRQESTLFTVLENGIIDFPLAGEPLSVAGLTGDEVAELLRGKIKIYENPKVLVAVREFASHKVVLNGMVEKPGTKILRREAVPLYVLLAEAGQLPNANKVTIKRAGEPNKIVRLTDFDDETLIHAGDYLHVAFEPAVAAAQFYFIGGVVSFGQKEFHTGLTLTQAILASGGVAGKNQSKAIISRQNAEGLLVVTEYNLKEIKQGKVPDPILSAGDRIEINP